MIFFSISLIRPRGDSIPLRIWRVRRSTQEGIVSLCLFRLDILDMVGGISGFISSPGLQNDEENI